MHYIIRCISFCSEMKFLKFISCVHKFFRNSDFPEYSRYRHTNDFCFFFFFLCVCFFFVFFFCFVLFFFFLFFGFFFLLLLLFFQQTENAILDSK